MLSFEQIKELIELVAEHRLRGFEIERAGFRFKIDGQANDPAPTVVAAPAVAAPVVAAPVGAAQPVQLAESAAPAGKADGAKAEADDAVEEGLHELTSPIVGTYYASPNPDADPFVSVGATVKRGQVLCIVEAMKLMNEIESDVDGEIVEIMPKNGQPVEFGEPLYRIRPR